MASGIGRIFDGVCHPIAWSEFLAWSRVVNVQVYADEFAVLRSMDLAFCEETNKELQAYRERTTPNPGAVDGSDNA